LDVSGAEKAIATLSKQVIHLASAAPSGPIPEYVREARYTDTGVTIK